MNEGILVTVAQGTLSGRKYTSHVTGQKYYGFKGIPYAKPPVGPLRFRPPEPPNSWIGIRDAHTDKNIFAQYIKVINKYLGDEDGLYLNIYTNQWPPDDLKPVMVYFHSGAFSMGSGHSSAHGADYIMTQDVILVTLNFRLGALGFLHLEGTDATPNNGLRDQNAALMWLRDNIKEFGGDPNNVTLFGNSSGAALVHFHMLAPASKGLFHRAIIQSGSVLYSVCNIPQNDTSSRAFRLGKALGFYGSDPQDLVDFLRSVPVNKLVLAAEKVLTDEESIYTGGVPFAACGETPSEDAFIPGTPEQMLKEGNFYQVPVIMGVTSAEGKAGLQLLHNNPTLNEVNGRPERIFTCNGVKILGKDKAKSAAKEIKGIYFGQEAVCDKTIQNFVKLQTDLFFYYPFYKCLTYHRKNMEKPVYIYKFSKKEPDDYFLPGMHVKSSKLPGAVHGGDILYLFYSAVTQMRFTKGSPEYKTMTNIVKLWTNFAKTGNPSEGLDIKWPQITAEGNLPYLDISDNLKVGKNFDFSGVKTLENILENCTI